MGGNGLRRIIMCAFGTTRRSEGSFSAGASLIRSSGPGRGKPAWARENAPERARDFFRLIWSGLDVGEAGARTSVRKEHLGRTIFTQRPKTVEYVMRTFDSLDEREILALAIALEEEDARIYEDFADGLQENHQIGRAHV